MEKINMRENREKYRVFCNEEQNIPIYSKDWWLDVTCGKDNWDVFLYEKGGKIWASMPFYKKKKYIFDVITMPRLIQNMGPYIKYPQGQKYSKKLSWEKEVMNFFIDCLPKYDFFTQSFHHSLNNWLPFYWKGFSQTTKYTYVIEHTQKDIFYHNFDRQVKSNIKKALKATFIEETEDIKRIYSLIQLTFSRQSKKVPYSIEFFSQIVSESIKRGSGKILIAVDKETKVDHVGIFIMWDKNNIYLLASGGNPKLRNSGAKYLLVSKAIEQAMDNGKNFDFEGSMLQNIESHNKSWGAIQKPYFDISKTNSILLKIKNILGK